MSRYSEDRRPSQSVARKPIAVIIPFRWVGPSGLLLGLILVLSIACGEEPATLAPTATVPASPTPVTVTTPRPTATPVPSPRPTQTPTFTPTPIPTPTQAHSPSPTAEPTLAPPASLAPLKLEVTSPSGDTVVDSDTITVVGIASPDATVSVNGYLVTPDLTGRFAVDLTIMPWDNPLAIEVIASSLTGEIMSLVRTVIFIP